MHIMVIIYITYSVVYNWNFYKNYELLLLDGDFVCGAAGAWVDDAGALGGDFVCGDAGAWVDDAGAWVDDAGA